VKVFRVRTVSRGDLLVGPRNSQDQDIRKTVLSVGIREPHVGINQTQSFKSRHRFCTPLGRRTSVFVLAACNPTFYLLACHLSLRSLDRGKRGFQRSSNTASAPNKLALPLVLVSERWSDYHMSLHTNTYVAFGPLMLPTASFMLGILVASSNLYLYAP